MFWPRKIPGSVHLSLALGRPETRSRPRRLTSCLRGENRLPQILVQSSQTTYGCSGSHKIKLRQDRWIVGNDFLKQLWPLSRHHRHLRHPHHLLNLSRRWTRFDARRFCRRIWLWTRSNNTERKWIPESARQDCHSGDPTLVHQI